MKLFGSRTCFIIATIVWGLFALFPVWLLFLECIFASQEGFHVLIYGANQEMVYPNTDLCDNLHLALFCIIMVEAFAIAGRNLFVKSDALRVWRLSLNAIFIVLLAPAVGASLSFAWDLLHYIRVMGMTPARRTGELFALFAFAVPIFSTARWLINTRAANKVILLAALSLVAAFLILVGINLSVIHHCPKTCQEQENADRLAQIKCQIPRSPLVYLNRDPRAPEWRASGQGE